MTAVFFDLLQSSELGERWCTPREVEVDAAAIIIQRSIMQQQRRRTKAAKQQHKSSKAAKKQHTTSSSSSSSSNLEYGSASLSLSYSADDASSQFIEDGPTVVTTTGSTMVVEADLGEQLAEKEAVEVEAQQETTAATTSSSSVISSSMADIEESVTATAATTPQSVAYSSLDEVDGDELHSSLLPSAATTTEAPNTMDIMSNITTFDEELLPQSHVNHSLSVLMKDSQSQQQANALGSSLARNKSTYGLSMTVGIALAAALMFLFALTRVSKYRHQRRHMTAANNSNDDGEHVIDDMEANYASGRNGGAVVQLQGDYPGDDTSSIWSADEDDDDDDDDDNVTAEDAGDEQDFVGDVYCDEHDVQDNGNDEEQEDLSSLPNTGVNEAAAAAAAAANTTTTAAASQTDSPNSIQKEVLAAYKYDVNTPGDIRDLRVELGDESPSSSDGKESVDDSTLEYDLETPRALGPYPAWWCIGSC